jgi:hypothetical protein
MAAFTMSSDETKKSGPLMARINRLWAPVGKAGFIQDKHNFSRSSPRLQRDQDHVIFTKIDSVPSGRGDSRIDTHRTPLVDVFVIDLANATGQRLMPISSAIFPWR